MNGKRASRRTIAQPTPRPGPGSGSGSAQASRSGPAPDPRRPSMGACVPREGRKGPGLAAGFTRASQQAASALQNAYATRP